MAFFKRVGTSTEKFNIKISVHSLKATFPATKKLFVKVKRGAKKAQLTDWILYTPPAQLIYFDAELEFTISVYKRGGKYLDKAFTFRVYELQPSKKIKDGKGKLKIGEMLNTDVPIFNQELKLKNSKSKISAALNVSVEFENLNPKIDRTMSVAAERPPNLFPEEMDSIPERTDRSSSSFDVADFKQFQSGGRDTGQLAQWREQVASDFKEPAKEWEPQRNMNKAVTEPAKDWDTYRQELPNYRKRRFDEDEQKKDKEYVKPIDNLKEEDEMRNVDSISSDSSHESDYLSEDEQQTFQPHVHSRCVSKFRDIFDQDLQHFDENAPQMLPNPQIFKQIEYDYSSEAENSSSDNEEVSERKHRSESQARSMSLSLDQQIALRCSIDERPDSTDTTPYVESSDSDDEFMEIPPEQLAQHSIPTAIGQMKPNANSKEGMLTAKEAINGVDSKKRTGSCATCTIF